jgi:hypothetical protein
LVFPIRALNSDNTGFPGGKLEWKLKFGHFQNENLEEMFGRFCTGILIKPQQQQQSNFGVK